MTENSSFLKRFWEDLQRRHVVRVAVGYTILAWGIVQVADILLPTFDAPDWLFRAIVAVSFLGFPVTVILAWVFDISGKQVVVTEGEGFHLPKWVKGVVAIPMIALVGTAGWWVWSGYVAEKASSVRPTDLTDQVPIVAVMPIRNITGDTDLDWYSEGLANLIRDNLTRSKFLRVASPMKWKAIIGDATDETVMAELAADEGIGFILSGEMLITPAGITVSSRLTDTEGGVSLSSRQLDGLSAETLLTSAGPIATQVKQGLNVPREEQVDIFAADFATNNLSAYESYVAGLGFFLNYQYERAEQAFNAALQLAPDFAVARYRLAYVQAVTGRTDVAINNAEQALNSEFLADREHQYIEAALALFNRDYSAAETAFQALLQEYPFEIEAREMLAKTYWGQYKQDLAVREMERLASEEPQNQVIWSTLGYYLLAMGDFDRARPALRRFAELAPDNANSYALLGDSFRFQGDYPAAIEQYNKALEINPDMREVAASLATIDYMEGEYAAAMEQLAEIAANEELIIRERLDAMFPLVSLHASRGDFTTAIEIIDRFADGLKEEQYREAMATSMKALFNLELGSESAARELAQSAITLSPGVATRYLFARGVIELRTGQFEQVTNTANEITALALPPEDPDRTEEKAAAYLLGMSLLEQGMLDESATQLQQAQNLEGYSYAIYDLGLARLALKQGAFDEAGALIDGAIKSDPVEPRIDLELERVRAVLLQAETYLGKGDVQQAGQQALAFMQRFDKAPPTHPDMLRGMEIAGAASLALAANKKGDPLAALPNQ